VAWAEAYLRAKFHLDPSNHLATVHESYRQDRQRSDSIGRTVLQTVAQKSNFVQMWKKTQTNCILIASAIHPQILIFSVFKIAILSPYWLQINNMVFSDEDKILILKVCI